MHADEAKQLYEEIVLLPGYEESLQLKPDVPNRRKLIERISEAANDCKFGDVNVLHAPSPWHAFFRIWLAQAQARELSTTLFFRGESSVNRPDISATLYRSDLSAEKASRARNATDILSIMFDKSEIISMKGDDPLLLARTVAQHYGIPTSLLDVTIDPAVAIFFACLRSSAKDGRIFIFEWDVTQALLGLEIVFPPIAPWSERLTIQRGFFLDLEQRKRIAVSDVKLQIHFPLMEGFNVWRNGAIYKPWPVEEQAATELINWTVEMAATNDVVSSSIISMIESRSESGSLLNYQCEMMFGFSLQSGLQSSQLQIEAGAALKRYVVAVFESMEAFINWICLGPDYLVKERLAYFRNSNRVVFDLYIDQVRDLHQRGSVIEPQYIALVSMAERLQTPT